jgi:solute carrier family 25 uncoupling protein 8/9
MEEGVKLHVLSSLLSGLVTTTITNPLDVIKTRMFVGRSQTIASCTRDVYHTHGLRGFMIGWNASYIRVGPQTMLIFVMAEFLRKLAGLQSL